MQSIKIKIILLLSFLLLSNCGFKIVDRSEINNFIIKELIMTGEKRINYKLKNNLLRSSKQNSKNNLILTIHTKQKREVKEKNIKNEITKYQILIETKVELQIIESSKKYTFNFNVVGDYSKDKSYSSTISNEKNLIENLIKNMTINTTNFINQRLNDI